MRWITSRFCRIRQIYINGQFVTPHGTDVLELINPSTKQPGGRVTLGDRQDSRDAIAAAKAAYLTYSRSSKQERMDILQRLHDAVAAKSEEPTRVMAEEFGGNLQFCRASAKRAAKLEAASVAFQVGYESPSQFSREYRRLFGASPLQDIDYLKHHEAVI
ncbi:aldehyde dehydrogenase domain protein [Janthinobacterium agaricidamnosum NBRC 102515 = DSM 9628]|uniref:Aldehyde dehydrogenase domain protein n=1 Tax=Janthinobacterium agaricidamnosum NBRC 102515 = DSM 9628 TaxID=1349767 RepID=W0VDZ8_9BURK|nr:aldehyde dehydrogenase family protein [Janthinobacterium agaricidamnosum]CDG85618.1 aldehyde dehydrogenase domain protein [Janthinobacterium agaricidamnosum NBRC 102515 = DSM 9628]